jgi:hypothetical protein
MGRMEILVKTRALPTAGPSWNIVRFYANGDWMIFALAFGSAHLA